MPALAHGVRHPRVRVRVSLRSREDRVGKLLVYAYRCACQAKMSPLGPNDSVPDPQLMCSVQLGFQANILLKYSTRTHYYDPSADQPALNITIADTANIKSRVQVRLNASTQEHCHGSWSVSQSIQTEVHFPAQHRCSSPPHMTFKLGRPACFCSQQKQKPSC
jgi:hypothetical protein